MVSAPAFFLFLIVLCHFGSSSCSSWIHYNQRKRVHAGSLLLLLGLLLLVLAVCNKNFCHDGSPCGSGLEPGMCRPKGRRYGLEPSGIVWRRISTLTLPPTKCPSLVRGLIKNAIRLP